MSKMTIPSKIEFVGHVVDKMTGNPNFETPNPDLATVTAAVDALDTAYKNAMDGSKSARHQMREADKALHDLVMKLALYVDYTSEGDADVILSSGFSLRKKPAPIGPMAQPENMRVNVTPYSGRLKADWDRIRGAHSYTVQYTLDPNDPSQWKTYESTTKSRSEVEGLESGQKYWIRVAALGSAGRGPWSEAVSHIVT